MKFRQVSRKHTRAIRFVYLAFLPKQFLFAGVLIIYENSFLKKDMFYISHWYHSLCQGLADSRTRKTSHGEIWLGVFSRIVNTIYIHSENLHFTFFIKKLRVLLLKEVKPSPDRKMTKRLMSYQLALFLPLMTSVRPTYNT